MAGMSFAGKRKRCLFVFLFLLMLCLFHKLPFDDGSEKIVTMTEIRVMRVVYELLVR